eukprot:87596-Karenia_brevis.AAC.1
MSWDVGENCTQEELGQTAQEMSWEVPDNHKASHNGLLAKPFVEYGFVSGRSIWADATEEEQEKMDEKLWLPEELPPPIVEAMPALNASRRSRASATAMATAL